MTATTTTAPIDLTATSQVPMSRLAEVEFRKALNTRAGLWFTVSIVVLCLVVVTIYALVAPDDSTDFMEVLGVSGSVLGSFLPILIIMLVTAESSQRTGLVTFALEPRRSRVVIAKFLAGMALAVAVMVLAAVTAAIGTLLGTLDGSSASWALDGNLIFNGFVLSNTVAVLIGFAIAMLLMNTAAAIVVYFVYSLILPGVVGILSVLSDGFEEVAPWIELNTAQVPLFTGDFQPTGEQWAQIATAAVIWMVLPLVLGIRRLLRIEFK
jgi:ABC-type transport system involved in multi-copper enzyme maturation permease subunit